MIDENYDNDPCGMLTAQPDPNRKQYRIRDIIQYCKEKNMSTKDISDEELEQFVIE